MVRGSRLLPWAQGALLALAWPLAVLPAVELWHSKGTGEAGGTGATPIRVTLNSTVKLATVMAHNPADRFLFPQANTAVGLSRLRLRLSARLGEAAHGDVEYEQQGRWASYDPAAAGFSTVMGGRLTRHPPFRVTPLYDTLIDERRVGYAHEIDRLLFAWHPEWGEVTVGRQAIGLGRGVLFSAVDLFAPFAPLEVDREWRRGVDALRVEHRLSDTTSVELLGVAGENWAESALLARVRGYVGDVDAEFLAGVRSQDTLAAGVVSASLFDAEIHCEAAVLRTRHRQYDTSILGDDRLVPKLVAGASYTFAEVGDGLMVVVEYFYSGFGAQDPREIDRLLFQPEARLRWLRGDMQILGRHAVGVQGSLPIGSRFQATANMVLSPVDGSGALSPSLRWDVNDTMSWTASVTAPWGRGSQRGNLRSEYGANPVSGFLQFGWYL